MVYFNDWCDLLEEDIGNHKLKVLTGKEESLNAGIEITASIVSSHYASEEQISRALARLGKLASAELIQGKLPTTKNIRSGDIGEIFATEWINAHSGGFQVPVKRLRWKDHRNMAMRGDDVIGILQNPETERLFFLKTEAKSRVQLTTKVLSEARKGLDNYDGRPSPHALSFISARLIELGNVALADAIDDTLLKYGIPTNSVTHLLFTFTGSAPKALLTTALNTHTGVITQWGVGLRVNGHEDFVGAIYEQVRVNANNT